MKKILILMLLLTLPLPAQAIDKKIYCGIGASLFQDPYNDKVIITKIAPNSPAAKSLSIGYDIRRINNQSIRYRNFKLEQIASLLLGEKDSKVTLEVRNQHNKREVHTIKRDCFVIPKNTSHIFDVHWKQVYPGEFYIEPFHPSTFNKLSWSFKNHPDSVFHDIQYWGNRRALFKWGYEACMTYPRNEQNACMMNLVNREVAQTNIDRQIQIQRQRNIILQNINHNLWSL